MSNKILYFSDTDLGSTLQSLLSNALKPNTHRTYSNAQNRYLNFCTIYDRVACPSSEETLLFFISYLFKDGLKGSSIRVYLSGVRNLHINSGVTYIGNTQRMLMALKGANVLSSPPTRKEPITFVILSGMLDLLKGRSDCLLLRAAMTLAFFGCLRAGEFCLGDMEVFDPKIHLCLADVTMLAKGSFSLLLKVSKTDKLSNGVTVYVGCSGDSVCSACAMKEFLQTRCLNKAKAPLLADSYGNVLRRSYFVSTTKLLVSMLGLPPGNYSGHSYRAGAATSGAEAGFDNWELKMLGRWNSEAYNIYLINPQIVSSFASRLVDHSVK